ncbi:hypothetical protein HJG60_009221 [Phyllostomus discolor]|uniref:Uncharacterized protein n=1 Tax=Phyllostomus discolor TaxID=89673 RepID=A0A833YQ27_9CHIR|nr:hypothetical protein HJG60_009221 [Phyllostomus discolor]
MDLVSKRLGVRASLGVSGARNTLSAARARLEHPTDGSSASAPLRDKGLGLAFQVSEQKAAACLSYQPHHLQTGDPAQRGEVIYPGDLQRMPPHAPPVPASKLGPVGVSTGMFFVLTGPCFDRERTPYQLPNLTDSLGTSSNAIFSRKLPLGLQHPVTLLPVPQPSVGP